MTETQLLRDALRKIKHEAVSLADAQVIALDALSAAAQPAYDQTALELCSVCGWKTLIPGEGCLNCMRNAQPACGDLDDTDPLSALDECARILESRRLMVDGVRCEVAAKNARAAMRRLASASQEQAKPNVQSKPVAWMMPWPNHSPSFTIDKSDYVSWVFGKAVYPDELTPLYTHPFSPQTLIKMLEDLEDATEQWASYVEVDTAPCPLVHYLEPYFKDIRSTFTVQVEGGK
jgi:hypothetical protein